MSATDSSGSNVFDLDFNILNAKKVFPIYLCGLFLLAYALSVFVSILHMRKEPVVYPLTRPQPDCAFAEYIILLRTSHMYGSSFDDRGRLIIQLIGSYSDSVPLHLRKGKGMQVFLKRGTSTIFVYHSPGILGDINEVRITLVNDAPNEIPCVEWKLSYLSVMHAANRQQWGCYLNKKYVCSDTLTDTVVCVPNTRDRNDFIRAICQFHMWFSMLNSPVRFGMYSNFINAIMIFFITSGVMFSMVVTVITQRNADYGIYSAPSLFNFLTTAFFIWLLEILVEAFFRKTVPRVSACSYSVFQGLMKPVPTVTGLRDFTIAYDWGKVSPLVPLKSVVVPYGSRHPSAWAVFPVEQVNSFYNMWGQLDLEVQKCGNWYIRSLNTCALQLPLSMRWLSKEATSRKEDMLVQQFIKSFISPMCYFCCWLVDWPMHYIDEPQQIGLIITHVICNDLVSLSKLKNLEYRARMAQICVHQWHGMICCVFTHVIKQSMILRGESSSGIKGFIQRTMGQFGKRSVKEIQAIWIARQNRLKQMNLMKSKQPEEEQQLPEEESDVEDENVSAYHKHSRRPFDFVNMIWHTTDPNKDAKKAYPSVSSMKHDFSNLEMDFNDFVQDFLVFDNTSSVENSEYSQTHKVSPTERCDGSDESTADQRIPPKEMPVFSIVREGMTKSRYRGKALKEFGPFQRNYLSVPSTSADKTEKGAILTKLTEQADWKTNTSISSFRSEMLDPNDVTGCHRTKKMDAGAGDSHPFEQDKNLNAASDTNVPDADVSNVHAAVKDSSEREDSKAHISERVSQPFAPFETVKLGPPFDTSYVVEPDPNNTFHCMRHWSEIYGYCCGSPRCNANTSIHRMVGVSSLELLKRILSNLLTFALNSTEVVDVPKLWQRKKVVNDMYDLMRRKAELYDSIRFRTTKIFEGDGVSCNMLLTSVLIILELLINVTLSIKEEGRLKLAKERRHLYNQSQNIHTRCLFCARLLKEGLKSGLAGCDHMDVLTRFFAKSTIAVAQREINTEFTYKITIQRYCAMIINMAIREVLTELEDPPLVMACKVTRAVTCSLVDSLVPKATSFRDMTADELRRVGTRRERIQARHDLSIAGNRAENETEKRRKHLLSTLLEQLSKKWRLNVKENELTNCARLMAQILVHERILGFALYSGFLTKEHEEMLGSCDRLQEIEKKAFKAVMKVAKCIVKPLLNQALQSGHDINVLFYDVQQEGAYLAEAVCVAQLKAEPTFLKTCCFYINDIIDVKIEEFKEFSVYMKSCVPSRDLHSKMKLKMLKAAYEFEKKIKKIVADYHSSVGTPKLRWGDAAVEGISPVPEELKPEKYSDAPFKKVLPSIVEVGTHDKDKEFIISKMLTTRLKVKSFIDLQKISNNKALRVHLAHVQAHLTEQIALLSQSITDTFSLDTDYHRDYTTDDLFNVEFYATGDLKHLLTTGLGHLMSVILVILTLAMTMITTLKVGSMSKKEMEEWCFACLYSFTVYIFVLEPLKCICYLALQCYT